MSRVIQDSSPGVVTTATWQAEPYLHIGPDRIYNPLTDRTLHQGEAGYAALRGLLADSQTVANLPQREQIALQRDGWLLPADADVDGRFLLKYVALESHTVCNQACYFCPVAVAPRKSHFMPTEMYLQILDQLAEYRSTIEAVLMINYNEPTTDRRFVDLVRAIHAVGLPPAVLTNGSGLTPARTDALLEMGGLRYLSINLSTLDAVRYAKERGADQLPLVLKHVDYLKDLPLAEQMEVVVLGTGDEVHQGDYEAIQARFAGSRLEVKRFEVMDRAGYLPLGLKAEEGGRLRGCENNGSRPLQHVHINPYGQCVFCCEDYDEYHVIGDLKESPLEEILTGTEIRRLRRWAYGLDSAPADFICQKCVFALRCQGS